MKNNNASSTKLLGSILLIIGWIIALALCGFLYQKFIYSSKEASFNVSTNMVKITLSRQADGHFWLPATVNGEEINFLIDTGATRTAIAQPLAKKLGLKFEYLVKASTANGTVDAYLTKIDELNLGDVQLFHVTAIILPNMDTDGLLGMNVLRKFSIAQRGDTMELTFNRHR